MSCVQSNRKVGFICMKVSIQLTRYLHSFIKFVQKFVLLSEKKDQKNTQYLSKKTTVTVINVFIFNKLDCQRLLLLINFKSICLRAFFSSQSAFRKNPSTETVLLKVEKRPVNEYE